MLLQIKTTQKRLNAFSQKYVETVPRHHQATSCTKKRQKYEKLLINKIKFGKIVLLAPLVMGRPKLELHHVEEASGYQTYANTAPEGCRKVKSEEFEIGGAKFVFLPKIDVLVKPFCWHPRLWGAQS